MRAQSFVLEQVEINPRVCGGKPVIRGTRIPVTVILDHLAAGSSVSDIVGKYPELSSEQVVAAIRYCHEMIDHTEFDLSPG